jgi:hypothetical protein
MSACTAPDDAILKWNLAKRKTTVQKYGAPGGTTSAHAALLSDVPADDAPADDADSLLPSLEDCADDCDDDVPVHVPDLITGPPHTHAGMSLAAVALLSARECVEPKSYRAALNNAEAPQWQAAMQHEYSSLIANGTWELVDPPPMPNGREQHVDLQSQVGYRRRPLPL